MHSKDAVRITNSVDPDQEQSDLGHLHRLSSAASKTIHMYIPNICIMIVFYTG